MYHKIFLSPDPAAGSPLQREFRSAAGALAGLALMCAVVLLVLGAAGTAGTWWHASVLSLVAAGLAAQLQPADDPAWQVGAPGLSSASALAALLALAGGPGAPPAPGWPELGDLLAALGCALLAFPASVRIAQLCAYAVVYLAGAWLIATVLQGSASESALAAVSLAGGQLAAAMALLCLSAGRGLLDHLTTQDDGGALTRRLLPFALLLPWLVSILGLAAGASAQPGAAAEAGGLALTAALVAAVHYASRVTAHAEAQVSGERDRLRRLLLAHGHGLLLLERGGRIALANPAMARIVGSSLEQLHGSQVAARLPAIADELERHYREDDLSQANFMPLGPPRQSAAHHHDGHLVPVEVGLTPLELDGQHYMLATVVDIRERLRLEQLQKTQEAQLKLFIRHAPVAIAMLDHELRYIAASERWLQDYGLGHQSLVGRHHFEVFPQLSSGERDRVGNALSGRIDRRESVRFPRADGGVDWFRSEIRPWRDDRQNIGGVLMFSELITAQIAAEAALQRMRKETERLLRGQVDELQALNNEIVRTSQSGLLVYRASGACLLANEAAARMIGSSVEQLVAEDFRAIDAWRRLGLLDSALRALGSGETIEFQVEYPCATGEAPQLAFTFSAVAAGNAQYLVVNAQDISSYIATQQELRAAGEAARQANDAKSLFIANMSHEIRTPMNAVLGLAYLLENDETLGNEPRDTARKISQAGRGLMGIVDDILDLSKIEAGQLELEHIPFRMSELFARVGTLLGGAGRGGGNELVLSEPPSEADALVGDPLRLEQVLLNLGGNALKFTRQGEVEIGATLLDQSPGHVKLRLFVRDTGIGIASELQEQIFQPFTQADISTARRFGGTGLGLTICHKIISAMGGTLGVASQPGQGSTFWCELWVARDPGVPAAVPGGGPRRHALVIEGHAAGRAALCGMLERLDWQAEAAADSDAALAHLARSRGGDPFQLILIDSRIAEAGGSRLARRLRVLPAVAVPCSVIVLEPMGSGDARSEGADAFDGVLVKPVASLQLADAIARIAGRRSPSAPPPPPAGEAGAKALSGMRILVVDDSATNLEVASRILERFNASVTPAASGMAALDLLREQPDGFDAVLMDIQMPDLDGLEATRRMREELGLAQLPVIALSGGAMIDQVEKARAAGMNDFLSKPFETPTLVAVLQRWRAAAPGLSWARLPADRATAHAGRVRRRDGSRADRDDPDRD